MPPSRHGPLIVAASFLIQGVAVGGMFAYGLLFTEFEAAFGWSRATISGAASAGTLVMGILAMVFGRLGDRLGPRGILSMSAISYGAGFALLSTIESPWQLYLFWGFLVGAGLATHDVVTLSTVARWFPGRRGIMSAIVKVGTATGQLTVPLIVVALVAAFGWRTACLLFGTVSLFVLLAAAQVMRRDPGGGDARPVDAARTAPRLPSAVEEPGARAVLASPQFRILCGSQFLVFTCLSTTTVHIVPYATDLGASLATATGMLAAIGGMSMLGRMVIGTLLDRIGGRRSLLIAYTLLLLCFAWLQFVAAPWMLYVFVAFYGMAHGGFFTLMAPTIAELFGTRVHGTLFGVVLFFGSVGGAIGPLAAGAVFDATASYGIAFGAMALLASIGMLLVSRLARPPAAGAAAGG